MQKETINFCGKNHRNQFCDFFTNEKSVKMCGHTEIFKVKIIECIDINRATHWSWWDNKDRQFYFTSPLKLHVTICFPYSITIYEENGEGKLMPVIVEML